MNRNPKKLQRIMRNLKNISSIARRKKEGSNKLRRHLIVEMNSRNQEKDEGGKESFLP